MPTSTGNATQRAELERIERYYDTVPRANASVELHRGLTLFVSTGGYPYYARPEYGGTVPITSAAVAAVRARQRELGVPQAFEWVHDLRPELRAAVAATGMTVFSLPLMVCRTVVDPGDVAAQIRVLDANDADLPAVQAAIGLGFAAPGTAIGAAGDAERAAATHPDGHDSVRRLVAAGHTVIAGAFLPGGPVAGGSYSPRDDVAEITGVATLPAYRRRGIGAALTAALVADARARDARVVFLSAGSTDIARVYARTGFERVATACIASAPSD